MEDLEVIVITGLQSYLARLNTGRTAVIFGTAPTGLLGDFHRIGRCRIRAQEELALIVGSHRETIVSGFRRNQDTTDVSRIAIGTVGRNLQSLGRSCRSRGHSTANITDMAGQIRGVLITAVILKRNSIGHGEYAKLKTLINHEVSTRVGNVRQSHTINATSHQTVHL